MGNAGNKVLPKNVDNSKTANSRKKKGDSIGRMQLKDLFITYAHDSRCLPGNGFLDLLSDIGLQPNDPIGYLIAYLLNFSEVSTIRIEDFVNAFDRFQCYDLSSIQATFNYPLERLNVKKGAEFEAISRFCYLIVYDGLEESVPLPLAIQVFQSLFVDTNHYPKTGKIFLEFLTNPQCTIESITKKEWFSMVPFFDAFEFDPELICTTWTGIFALFLSWHDENYK